MWATKERNQQAEQGSENFTLLGKGTDFKGVVNFDGTVRVDGRVEGEIHTTGTLIVGEHAVIEGISSEAMVDAAGVASNFERMVRIADATGIQLDERMAALSQEVRDTLQLERFAVYKEMA